MKKFIILLFFITNIFATESKTQVILKKVDNGFAHTWLNLQKYIKKQGYKIAFRQHCDVAMTQRDYQTDKYRILFFGKYQEVKDLTQRNPELTPHLPLAITTIEGKNNTTTLVSDSPQNWLSLIKSKQDKAIVNQWYLDILQIIKNTQNDIR